MSEEVQVTEYILEEADCEIINEVTGEKILIPYCLFLTPSAGDGERACTIKCKVKDIWRTVFTRYFDPIKEATDDLSIREAIQDEIHFYIRREYLMQREAEKSAEPSSKETGSMRPSHYHNAPFDVLQTQAYVSKNFRQAAARKEDHNYLDETDFESRVWCIGAALKHLLRLGLKDDIDVELSKAENYIHKARAGKWLTDEPKETEE